MRFHKILSVLLAYALLLSGYTTAVTAEQESSQSTEAEQESIQSSESEQEVITTMEKVDMSAWYYEADDDVYWQVEISYCSNPADENYETMGIFVPGAYFTGTENGDGTYTCELNPSGIVGNYTAETAPIVFPVNTPGYSAMEPPTGYTDVTAYTKEGFVYMQAGCRGRDHGAPAGVTDLKAAVRYYRYSSDVLPGSTDRIFSFGMSGGGAQSALMGTTGDSELYTPYLEAIGAVSSVSDAICGSMCWCPITSLDIADAAYEWNMGSARSDLDDETKALSDGLAQAFAEYINALGLKDSAGTVLTLEESSDGIYQAGSYYEYIRAVIETSLNHFLEDTTFPYDAGESLSEGMEDMGNIGGEGLDGGMPAGGKPDGETPDGKTPDGLPDQGPGNEDQNINGGSAGNSADIDFTKIDDIQRTETTGGLELTGTYETPQDYIDTLNADGEWVQYDSDTNTVTITSVSDFVNRLKSPSKSVGAFDDLNRSQGENTLFGYGDGNGAHFDSIEAALLAGTDYEAAFTEDLAKTDSLGNTVDYRVNMYNPMYYLCDYYEGAGTATVADYFRIRTGIEQGDTALSTEVNLALALEAYGADVDFETVWGEGHTQAERTGDSGTNFIQWVNECLK